MNKQAFLARLEAALSGLPEDVKAESLAFYGEMIDDRMEEGLPEAEAVAGIGSVDEIVSQIVTEVPLPKLVRERVKPKRRLRVWEIVLLALGSPIWLSLLIAAAAVVLSLYIVLWSLILSLWAVELSFAVAALAGAAVGILLVCRGDTLPGLALIGAALVLAGLAVFLWFGCVAATRGTAWLTKTIARGIKSLFVRKEDAR